MKPLAELRGKHAGQDIYVLGSGASMDFLDPAFFDGKITIGINLVCRKFRPTYTVLKDGGDWSKEVIASGTTVICSEYAFGDEPQGRNDFGQDSYVFPHLTTHDADGLSVLGTDKIVVTWSTLSSAMHIAAEMGAANIILCGIDGGSLDGRLNFASYNHTPRRYFYWKFIAGLMQQTREVRDALQSQYGCRIYSLSPFLGLTMDGHTFRSAESTPHCRFCGADGLAFRCESVGGLSRFYDCPRCGCCTSNLDYEDVAVLYAEPGYADHHRVPRSKLIDAVRHNFLRIVEASAPEKSCLDVGCLEGALMESLAGVGWSAQGWDIDSAGRPEGTIVGTEFRAATIGRQFGVVVSREVIEHVPDPRRHFRELAGAVMPDGLLHLQCPRPHPDFSDGIAYQTAHLTLLEPSAVRQMIYDAGLRIEHCELWANGQLWHARKPT